MLVTAHACHHALRGACAQIVRGEAPFGVALLLLVVVLLIATARAFSRAARRRGTLALALAGLASFALAYGVHLSGYSAGDAALPSLARIPSGSMREHVHTRPPVVYRINRHHFRGADPADPPTRPRLCVVGDSFVFGSGVEESDTLPARLERELSGRVEVLNLGVPGHNLASHLAVYSHGLRRLGCDAILLSLTLPNDLSAGDINDELRAQSSVSTSSLVAFALGDPVGALFFNRTLSESFGPPEIARLRHQWARLGALHPGVPALVFSYNHTDVLVALPDLENVSLAPSLPLDLADYIEGDGHPNAHGNQRFAQHLAAVLQSDPALARALLPSAAPGAPTPR